MSYSELSEAQMQNLLDALTNAIVVGQDDVEPITRRYGADPSLVKPYIGLIQQLNRVLKAEQPRDSFVRSLKLELTWQANPNADLSRFPVRARIAAVIAAVAAGFLLILRRRNHGENRLAKGLDVPILQR
jgi:hypothetical protein